MTLCVRGFSTNLLLYNQSYICIDSLIQEVTESHHQSNKMQFLQPSTLYYMFSTNICFYLLLLSKNNQIVKITVTISARNLCSHWTVLDYETA